MAAMNLALSSGDEDAALVAFAAARERDIDEVIAHAIDLKEDWEALYSELIAASGDPDLDPGDKFELFAQPLPDKNALLSAPQSDINVYGQIG